jgi:hypothetical protein
MSRLAPPSNVRPLSDAIHADGYSFVEAPVLRSALEGFGTLADWDAFAASWDDLGADTYMADGGRYRKRRHAVFHADAEAIRRKPAQPHYQSRDYNPLNGGIERWFDPVKDAIADGASMQTILRFCHDLFGQGDNGRKDHWHVEIHQFRIEARQGQEGRPTPEGMHRDGVDYVLVLLVNRDNIASGVTSVHDTSGKELGSFTLTHPLDAALVDDHRVMHGVTPVEPLDPAQPGHRDVLVVTFRREKPKA